MIPNTQSLSPEKQGLPFLSASSLLNQSAWETLGEEMELFFNSLKLGRVRGVVGIAQVPDSGSRGGQAYLQLIRELISRDILVTLSNGEGAGMDRAADFLQSAGDGLAEFCDFIGIKPVLNLDGDGGKTGAFEFYRKLARHAGVDLLDLPITAIGPCGHQAWPQGPGFAMEEDPVRTADLVDAHIHDKRLGLQWCDRCGCRFSPFS